MPFALELEKTQLETSLVVLEPALNAFGTMLLVSIREDDPGIHEWVTKTRAAMSTEEQFRHKLVTIGFHYSVQPRVPSATFETYLAGLDSTPPSAFRQRLLDAYSEICMTNESQKDIGKPVDWDDILSSAANYVSFLKYRFGEEHVDEEVETRAYEYVIDPAALKQLITGHMRWFWKNYLQTEWNRVRPMLEETVRAFNQVDVSNMSRLELVEFVTGKEYTESKWGDEFKNAKALIFIPNAHFGPYIRAAKIQDNFYIYFGAHLPEILQMIAEHGQMRSQEIMEAINLSQPSISRYLTQITATGYLQERRESGAKVYVLNQDRIEKTLKAVHAFLIGRS